MRKEIKMTKKQIDYIENHTIRLEAGNRGGGIEIDLSELLCGKGNYTDKYEGYRMTAYQNYLGGGMLGRICHDYNFDYESLPKSKKILVDRITETLKRYFHSLTNHDDIWESESYLHNQISKPVSAY